MHDIRYRYRARDHSARFGRAERAGRDPPSRGRVIGYRGDLALAVLVGGGGTGADSAGPIASAFLRGL